MDHSYLFKLLNIPDDGSIIINDVEIIADTKYVYISRPSIPSYCLIVLAECTQKVFISAKSNTLSYKTELASSLS